MALKTIDQKGRLNLGQHYAGKLVDVVEDEHGVAHVTPQRAIPEREAWLWQNDAALDMVRRGLDEARRGRTSSGPDLESAFAFADETPEDE
jgi:hypothetical protein